MPVPPLPTIAAPEPVLAAARTNCATFARERAEYALAASYEQGEQDAGWNVRHQVAKLRAEGVV